MKSRLLSLIALSSLLLLSGCASRSLYSGPQPTVVRGTSWTVTPLINNTATPYAGSRAQQILAALLSSHDTSQVMLPPPPPDNTALPMHNGAENQTSALAWAHIRHIRYALTGSVDEWHYKVGLNGIPAVGFTLSLVDLDNGHILWSGAAAATGGSREGIAVLAQHTLNRLLTQLLP